MPAGFTVRAARAGVVDAALRESILVAFRTTAGVVRDLRPGEEYARP